MINHLGYLKLVVTLINNLLQIWLKASRKSTRAFRVENSMADFVGSVLSSAQLKLDAAEGS